MPALIWMESTLVCIISSFICIVSPVDYEGSLLRVRIFSSPLEVCNVVWVPGRPVVIVHGRRRTAIIRIIVVCALVRIALIMCFRVASANSFIAAAAYMHLHLLSRVWTVLCSTPFRGLVLLHEAVVHITLVLV